jgi:antiviral helicase SKI2
MNDLAVLHEEVSSMSELPEVEWTRMRELEFQDLLRQRIGLVDRLSKMGCQLCPDFEEHVSVERALPGRRPN